MRIQDVPGTVLVVIMAVIMGVLGAVIIAEVLSTTTDKNATYIANEGRKGMMKIFSLFVLIGLVFGMAIMIRALIKGIGGGR